ncbi:MAG: DUF302 domain-containing protein [Deltaproteobacteria bacterium]|nr:DUF302 domain-containing protein [Deltaproteobacteria bacterium]
MIDPHYGMTKSLGRVDFDQALARVLAALKTEGFGVLTEIDVKKTMKEKLDADFRNYRILGACNPPLAHKALTTEAGIGLLLPCNVIVLEEEDGSVTVSIGKPREMFKIVSNAELEGLAGDVEFKLTRALAAV